MNEIKDVAATNNKERTNQMANINNKTIKVSQLETVDSKNIDNNDFFLFIDYDNKGDKSKKLTMGQLVNYMLSAVVHSPTVSSSINNIVNAAVEEAVEDLDISANVLHTIQTNSSEVLDMLDGKINHQFILDTN